MANRRNLYDRKKARIEGANARAEARAKRSDVAQIVLLFERGHGHCKEAQKLLAKLPTGDCFTLPNGDCVAPICVLHNG